MFSANNRSDHFSNNRLSPNNDNDIDSEHNNVEAAAENVITTEFNVKNTDTDVLESERQAIISKDPHPTFLNRSMCQNLTTSFKQTQNNTDNKDIKFHRTIKEDSNKSDKHVVITEGNKVMSPIMIKAGQSPSKFGDSQRLVMMESIGPQPMDSFSDRNKSFR